MTYSGTTTDEQRVEVLSVRQLLRAPLPLDGTEALPIEEITGEVNHIEVSDLASVMRALIPYEGSIVGDGTTTRFRVDHFRGTTRPLVVAYIGTRSASVNVDVVNANTVEIAPNLSLGVGVTLDLRII